MNSIRVFLADDHAMIRAGLARLLGDDEGCEVVGEAGSGAETLAGVRDRRPDVLVLDYALPDVDGTSVVAELRREGERPRVLMLTQHSTVRHAQAALEAGAEGFLCKSDDLDDLVLAVRTVHGGGRFVSASLEAELATLLATPKRKRKGLQSLSARELELLRHLGEGLTLQEASHAMGDISESTASTYRARLMKKLGLENTAQIIRFALENEVSQ